MRLSTAAVVGLVARVTRGAVADAHVVLSSVPPSGIAPWRKVAWCLLVTPEMPEKTGGGLSPRRPLGSVALLAYAWNETVGQMRTLPVSISYGFELCGLIGRKTF